jgi:hypothetical protein
MPVTSISGELYFLTFIDDYSRYITVYVIRTKDEAIEKFKSYTALVENQLGRLNRRFGEMGLEDSVLQNSTSFCVTMELHDRQPHPILLNQMVWQNEATVPS